MFKKITLTLFFLFFAGGAYAESCAIPPLGSYTAVNGTEVLGLIKLNDSSLKKIETTFNTVFTTQLLGSRVEPPTSMIPVGTPTSIRASSSQLRGSGFGAIYVRNGILRAAEEQRTQKILSAMIEANELEKLKMLETYKKLQSDEMNYVGTLSNKETEMTLGGVYHDENGNSGEASEELPSYHFFKTACERNKRMNKIVGSSTQKSRSLRVGGGTSKKAVERDVNQNIAQKSSQQQINHYQNYCTLEDVNLGLCEEESFIPNGDVNSYVMLNPTFTTEDPEMLSKIENVPEDFVVEDTYSEEEYQSAMDYANNVIGAFKVSPPLPVDIRSSDSAPFVRSYKGNSARLSLAEFSYFNAIEKRRAIGELENGVPFSEKSLKDNMTEEMFDSDSNINILGASELSVEMSTFLALNLKSKLELDKYQHLDRIELLLASYLTQIENGSQKYEFLNSLKSRQGGGI